jgi:hypothetical protein
MDPFVTFNYIKKFEENIWQTISTQADQIKEKIIILLHDSCSADWHLEPSSPYIIIVYEPHAQALELDTV